MLTALPTLLFIAGSSAIWLVRQRHDRVSLAVATGTSILVWVISLALLAVVPNVFGLSVWKPETLFESRLELVLDEPGWIFAFLTATVMLSITLTNPAREGVPTPGARGVALAYTGISIAVMLSGNLLTVAMLWTIMDLLSFVFLLRVVTDVDAALALLTKLAIDISAVLLITTAAVIDIRGSEPISPLLPLQSTLANILLAGAVFLRLGLLAPRLQPVSNVRRGVETLFHLLPPTTALAVLARQWETAVPSEASSWLRVAGMLGIVIGGLRWGFQTQETGRLSSFVLGVSSLGVLSVGVSQPAAATGIVAAGSILLTTGVILAVYDILSGWHRGVILVSSLMLAGLPFTPGAVLIDAFTPRSPPRLAMSFGAVGLLGVLALTLGSLRVVFAPRKPWPSSEAATRIAYGVAGLLPILGGILVGWRMGVDLQMTAILVFSLVVGMSVFLVLRFRHIPSLQLDRIGRLFLWFDLRPFFRLLLMGFRVLLFAMRTLSETLEGEGAMLWVFVMLLLLAVALGGGAP